MSFDEDDWARDQYELEIGNQAIEQFQTERLQSFYERGSIEVGFKSNHPSADHFRPCS